MSLKDKFKKGKELASEILKDAGDKTSEILDDAANLYKETDVKDKFNKGKDVVSDMMKDVGSKSGEIFDDTAKRYKESVVKEKLDAVTDATTNQLDVISGQKMYDLVQKRVELQNELNDVLAYKLQEALERIEALEKEIAVLKVKS